MDDTNEQLNALSAKEAETDDGPPTDGSASNDALGEDSRPIDSEPPPDLLNASDAVSAQNASSDSFIELGSDLNRVDSESDNALYGADPEEDRFGADLQSFFQLPNATDVKGKPASASVVKPQVYSSNNASGKSSIHSEVIQGSETALVGTAHL